MTKQERIAMGQRLRQQRNRLGLTREQFAELADIGTGYYGQGSPDLPAFHGIHTLRGGGRRDGPGLSGNASAGLYAPGTAPGGKSAPALPPPGGLSAQKKREAPRGLSPFAGHSGSCQRIKFIMGLCAASGAGSFVSRSTFTIQAMSRPSRAATAMPSSSRAASPGSAP